MAVCARSAAELQEDKACGVAAVSARDTCVENLSTLSLTGGGAVQDPLRRRPGVALPPQANFHEPDGPSFWPRLDMDLPSALTGAFAVLYLHVDGLTSINDAASWPHDEVRARIVTERLQRTVRSEDRLGRVGGDEFVCLLTRLPGRERLSQLSRKMLVESAALSTPDGLMPLFCLSIGIANCRAGAKPSASINMARHAMRHARQRQIGFAFFEDIA